MFVMFYGDARSGFGICIFMRPFVTL